MPPADCSHPLAQGYTTRPTAPISRSCRGRGSVSWQIADRHARVSDMRTLWLFASCAWLVAADLSQLQHLDEANRAFELRRALRAPGGTSAETLYYRGVTASRFG